MGRRIKEAFGVSMAAKQMIPTLKKNKHSLCSWFCGPGIQAWVVLVSEVSPGVILLAGG